MGSAGGRKAVNGLEVDWHSRAKTIWSTHFHLKRAITELHSIAHGIDARTIGSYDNFLRKLNGTLPASKAHAEILFKAGEFDQAGITLSDWMASDEDWAKSVSSLAPLNSIGFLTEHAAKGTMLIEVTSTPRLRPLEWRRLRDADPVENELHIKEYLQLTATFPGSSDPRPVYLLALEWSATSRDWQIFNFVKASLLDIEKPTSVIIRSDEATARISAGVQIAGPPEPFDLFVLGQRTPFDHKARSYLDNLGRRATLTPLEVSRLIRLLFGGATAPDVAITTYAVVD